MDGIKIGVTEHGDASVDFLWVSKLPMVNGAILITKNITDHFIDNVIKEYNAGYNIIVHATCTGWGGTVIEPNVPNWKEHLGRIQKLISFGFPVRNIVLRVDPIIPTDVGLRRVNEVLSSFKEIYNSGVKRVRISILDCYPHVRQRLKAAGFTPPYGDKFTAPHSMMLSTAEMLLSHIYMYEGYAEPLLQNIMGNRLELVGCVSQKDLELFGLELPLNVTENPQNRRGCKCLSCKMELLSVQKREPCKHGCIYCFWKKYNE